MRIPMLFITYEEAERLLANSAVNTELNDDTRLMDIRNRWTKKSVVHDEL